MTAPTLFSDERPPSVPSPWEAAHAPHVATSPTSRAAAVSIAAATPTLRDRVLSTIAALGSATDEEIADALGMNGSTERPRRVELAQAGLIHQVGTRATRSGRQAAVWEVVA